MILDLVQDVIVYNTTIACHSNIVIGTNFIDIFSILIQISMVVSFGSHPNSDELITTIVCTCCGVGKKLLQYNMEWDYNNMKFQSNLVLWWWRWQWIWALEISP